MRYFIVILLSCFIQQVRANTYYFSSSAGNDLRTAAEAQNPSTPWRTINKLNEIFYTLNPGDAILFRAGEIFDGSIVITRSGAFGNPIVFGSYGTGPKPVISGFSVASNWLSIGSGVWETTLPSASMVNMLLINGQQIPIGRYPNLSAASNGYLYHESATGNTQIIDNDLPGFPDWTGGEVVIRKTRWVLDRNQITRHSGGTIDYISESAYQADQRYGYFIQNHPKTLDINGEWYYKPNERKLGMYFSSGSPQLFLIHASTHPSLVTSNNQSNITFSNINFVGSNQSTFDIRNGQHFTVTYCEFQFSGGNAISGSNLGDVTIEFTLFNKTNNVAISLDNTSNLVIRNNRIINTAMIPGMGRGDAGSYEAILLTGNNQVIERNEIENTGYIPITFRGNSVVIRNNFISNFAMVKDDAGGIYSWNNIPNAPLTYGIKIIGNVVLHGIGAGAGTDNPGYFPANGIYMDDNTANAEITDNTVAHMGLYGIYLHNAHEIALSNNTLFNNRSQLVMAHDGLASYANIRNVNLLNNILFSKEANQPVAEYKTNENDLASFGTFDHNYYSRPVNDNFTINISYQVNGAYVNKAMNVEEWKTLYGKDQNSKKSPVTIQDTSFIRFEYNATAGQKSVPLDREYIDVKNNSYSGSVTLAPFTSIVLIAKAGAQTTTADCEGAGSITREQWDNITGNEISNIPLTRVPTTISQLSAFQTIDVGDMYAARIRGYICPPQTGNYTFYISGDDAVELWLSTDENPSNKIKIAGVLSWTNSQEYTKYPSQTSSAISLQKGRKYYIEALHKEGAGGDNVSVAWQLPDGKKEAPIPGVRLLPFVGSSTPTTPTTPSVACSGTGSILWEQWTNVDGNNVSNIPLDKAPGSTKQLTQLEINDLGDAYADRFRGYVCPPESGNYTFMLSGDDAAELWLSTDDNPVNRIKIASILSYTAFRNFSTFASQVSGPISLVAGRKYYIEVLHKEGGGGDHLTVGWQLPGGNREVPLAGNRLIPFSVSATPQLPTEPTTAVCSGTGSILREQWDNIAGNDISSIPLSKTADKSSQINLLEVVNAGDHYGQRIRGYLCPPQNGSYVFYVSGDDAVELSLSTDANAANKIRIATVPGWTGIREWTKFLSQTSPPIVLKAGQNYYLEVLHKEGDGGDHFSVGWQLPDGVKELPIPGNRLLPYSVVSTNTPTCVTGSILREQWSNVSGNDISNIPLGQPAGSSSGLTQLEFNNLGDNYGDRIRGYICPPKTGNYQFFIAGDDAVELWLSTDENPSNKKKIASLLSYTNFREWNKFPSQISAPVALEAGRRYYLEVLHKEGGGGDHLSVGWLQPDGTTEIPIPGSRLSPFSSYTNSSSVGGADLNEIAVFPIDDLKVFPNPFHSMATIRFAPAEDGNINISVYDLKGRLVKTLFNGAAKARMQQTVMLTSEGMSSGVYIVRLTGPRGVMHHKLTLAK